MTKVVQPRGPRDNFDDNTSSNNQPVTSGNRQLSICDFEPIMLTIEVANIMFAIYSQAVSLIYILFH